MTRELKTHCPQGHEYTPENVYQRGSRRWCKKCKWAKLAASRKAKRKANREARKAEKDFFKYDEWK